jgi:hypothetical protein
MSTEKYEHHGTKVSVQPHLKGKHREHCLCWQQCKYFKPESREENCAIANALYAICVLCNVTTPVWECPKYEKV